MKIIILIVSTLFGVHAAADVSSIGPTRCKYNAIATAGKVIDVASQFAPPRISFFAEVDENRVEQILTGLEIWTVTLTNANHTFLKSVNVTVTDCTDATLALINTNKMPKCDSLDHTNVNTGTICRTSKNSVLKLLTKNSIGEIW